MCTIKAFFGNEIHRFVFETKSFDGLVALIKNLFDLKVEINIHITYIDDENEEITIGSSSELSEAVRVSGSESLKLSISIDEKPEQENKEIAMKRMMPTTTTTTTTTTNSFSKIIISNVPYFKENADGESYVEQQHHISELDMKPTTITTTATTSTTATTTTTSFSKIITANYAYSEEIADGESYIEKEYISKPYMKPTNSVAYVKVFNSEVPYINTKNDASHTQSLSSNRGSYTKNQTNSTPYTQTDNLQSDYITQDQSQSYIVSSGYKSGNMEKQ